MAFGWSEQGCAHTHTHTHTHPHTLTHAHVLASVLSHLEVHGCVAGIDAALFEIPQDQMSGGVENEQLLAVGKKNTMRQ